MDQQVQQTAFDIWVHNNLPSWIATAVTGVAIIFVALTRAMFKREIAKVDAYGPRIDSLERSSVDREDFRRLEDKVDAILTKLIPGGGR